MCNPRTTVFGLIAATAAFFALYGPDMQADKKLIDISRFIAAGGLASLGIAAKDSKQDGDKK